MEFLPQLREGGVYRLVNNDAGEESSPVSNSCCARPLFFLHVKFSALHTKG